MSTHGLSVVAALAIASAAGSAIFLLYRIRDRRPRVTVTFGALVLAALGGANSRRKERARRLTSVAIHLAVVT
ncbi:MAG TPA: hypothetical protein VIV60_07020, partial [Polyangiaceae bacterium]